MAQKQYLADLLVDGTLTVNTVANASVDTDKFLVLDGTTVKYRTGAQLLSDIGPITIPLSSLTAATGTNSINNAGFGQTWNWNSLNSGTALTITTGGFIANGAATALSITVSNTASNSLNSTGIYVDIGGGATNFTSTGIKVVNARAGVDATSILWGVTGRASQAPFSGAHYAGVLGIHTGTSDGTGVIGRAGDVSNVKSEGRGVYGESYQCTTSYGIYGLGTGTGTGYGGYFTGGGGPTAYGVYGTAGGSTNSYGGYFTTSGSNGTKYAVWASASGGVTNYALYTNLGNVQFNVLAGSGTRMVVADANGLLSTQALPTGDPLTDGDKGDITVSSSGTVWTIDNNVVSLGKIQQIATASFLGRVTSATGNVEVLTGTQATTLLDTFTSVLKGLVPASGGGTTNFLRADGTWATPPGSTSNARTVESFTATASQTTFTVTGGYTVGQIDVYYNGSRLNSTEYTASNGSTVVLGTGAPAGTILDIVTYQALSGSYDLNALTDVVISSPVTNQVLQYNGSSWVNATISTGSGYTVTSQTTNYNETATTGIKIIKGDTTGGSFTVNLPTAVGNTAVIHVKKVAGTADLNVEGFGSETIDGGLNAVIKRVGDSIMLVSDNTNWIII